MIGEDGIGPAVARVRKMLSMHNLHVIVGLQVFAEEE